MRGNGIETTEISSLFSLSDVDNHQSALTSWIDPAGGCVSDPGKARDRCIDHEPDRKRYEQFFEIATATAWRSRFSD
jgi:hypothetical protein